MIFSIVVFFSLACVMSLILTALIRELAPRIGLTDRPDGHRKLHRQPMPLGGGLAILMATVSVLGVVLTEPRNYYCPILWQFWPSLSSLALAGLVIVVVGLIDDRVNLRGWQKLVGQIIAVSVLIHGGLVINRIGMFGYVQELGWLSVPVTLFWLLGAVNALNLLDGIDGLAAMIGIILASTIAMMAMNMGRYEVAIVGFVFAGSLAGFMRFNFPPATIYLGDTGSMLIGLVVGTLAILGSLKGAGTVLLAAPLAIWAIPIFDSTAAILRRKLTGRSIYTTDRGHLHHRLLTLLGSNRKVLAWLAVCCMLTSAAALLSVYFQSDLIALLICMAIVIIFIITGVFGRVEVLLLGSRLRQVGRALVAPTSGEPAVRQLTVHLQGSRQWELLWATLTDAAEKLCLTEIYLDLNLPAAQEGYHASWERPDRNHREQCWRLEIPLTVDDRRVGRLAITGQRSGACAAHDIQQLLDVVEPFEMQISALSRPESPRPADDLTAEHSNGEQAVATVPRSH